MFDSRGEAERRAQEIAAADPEKECIIFDQQERTVRVLRAAALPERAAPRPWWRFW